MVRTSGLLFFGSFAFGELAVDGADLKTVLYILLGSFGGAKEMNILNFAF